MKVNYATSCLRRKRLSCLLILCAFLADAFSGAAAEAPRSDFGHAATVTWRLHPKSWLPAAAFAEVTNVFAAERITGKIALFVTAEGFVHHPLPLDDLRRQAAVGADRLAALKTGGYEAGFNLLGTIGHLDEMPHNTPDVAGAQHAVSEFGSTSKSTFCLHDAIWRERYLTPALTALARAKPDFIWLDDDIRVCFCPACLRRRTGKIGSPADFTAFCAWLNDAKEGAAHRRAFYQENREALGEFFAFAASVVRGVDPAIVIGDMEADRPYEGMAYAEKYRALGNGRFRTYWRSGCDGWSDARADDFLVKLNRQAQMAVRLPRGNAKFESEIENWPYQIYGKSVAFNVFETLLYAAVATDGAAYNILAHPAQDPFRLMIPRLRTFEALRPTMDAFVAAGAAEPPRGVWNGVTRDTGCRAPTPGGRWQADMPWGFDSGFLGTDAQKAGFAVAYRAEDADCVAPTALALDSMSDAELDRLFAGGVYLDGAALEVALRRGRAADIGFAAGRWFGDVAIEELLDDPLNLGYRGFLRNVRPTMPPFRQVLSIVPANKGARALARLVDGFGAELAPCVQGVYENARGGRVCVNGYTPWEKLGDVHSIRQLRSVMRWLSRNRLTGCLVGDGRAALWVRGDKSVILANFGADAEEGLSVDLVGEAWSRGLRKVADPSTKPLLGERRGIMTRYRLPPLAPWSVTVFSPSFM